MTLFLPGNRAFKAVADALNFGGTRAITKIRDEVVPGYDVQAAVEAGVAREIVLLKQIADIAGGATTSFKIDPHSFADWDEAYVNGVLKADIGASIPQPEEDCWILDAGVNITSSANWSFTFFYKRQTSVALATIDTSFFYADVSVSAGGTARGAVNASPILIPLPWWIPPTRVSQNILNAVNVTTNAVDTTVKLTCLAAPPGVFRRLYG